MRRRVSRHFFFFNDTATTEIYTLSLHDALPISWLLEKHRSLPASHLTRRLPWRSEEHTSELQSPCNLVCRLLLEKKNSNSYVANNRWPLSSARGSWHHYPST